MNCEDCGAELTEGGYYCGCCGRPVGFDPGAPATTVADPGLDEVPEPAASMEAPSGPAIALETPFRTRVQGKGLCSMCMGAFPDTVLSSIDGKPYCPDCSPMVGRRRDRELGEQAGPAPGGETMGALGAVEPLMFREERASGGGAKGLVAVVILVLLAGAGFAAYTFLGGDRIDALMSGLDTSRGDAFLLAQSYIPGESMDYQVRGDARATGDVSGGVMGGGGGDIDLTLALTGGIRIDVLKVDEQGNAELSVTTNDFDMDVDMKINGTSMPLGGQLAGPLDELRGKTTVLEVDPFGNPVGGGTADADGMQQMMSGQFGEMPRHHVKVGDTWSARMPLSGAGVANMPPGMSMGNLSFAVKYRVEGFKRFAGRDCMVISMQGDLDGGDSMKMPFFEEFRFDMGLKGVIFYDVSIGRMVKVAMDLDLELAIASPMGGGELDLGFEMDVDLK